VGRGEGSTRVTGVVVSVTGRGYTYHMATGFTPLDQREAALTEISKPAGRYLVVHVAVGLTVLSWRALRRLTRQQRWVVRERADQVGYWAEPVYTLDDVSEMLQKIWVARLSSQPDPTPPPPSG
jgi:hypothetical protein